MSARIPVTIADVDAAWLAAATGWTVDSLEIEQIGVGVGVSSAVYRCRLTGSGPDSVIVKLAAEDEAAVFTSTILRMYIREVRFFAELAERSPIRVPAGHYGAVDEETSAFVQVMEDMGELRVVDQNEGMALPDAEVAVDALARWHATWWRDADDLVEQGTAMAVNDPIYPAILPTVFAEGWEKLTNGMELDPLIRELAPAWSDAMGWLTDSLDAQPNTIIHGDYRADNMLFDADGNVVLLDFQITGRGSGSYDLAYFVTQSLAPDLATEHETALFDRWRSGLIGHGVPEVDTEGLWDRYREAAYYCLVYPVVASRGMDLADERQYRLLHNMNTRWVRAADQLRLADLLR